MKWARSLIRISNHEVETVQKRVAEIVERRIGIEMQMAALEAELTAERAGAARIEAAGLYLAGFVEGVRIRKAALEEQLAVIAVEESGARDALAEAFEALKKYEHVLEAARAADAKERDRRETAEMDEVGLRMVSK